MTVTEELFLLPIDRQLLFNLWISSPVLLMKFSLEIMCVLWITFPFKLFTIVLFSGMLKAYYFGEVLKGWFSTYLIEVTDFSMCGMWIRITEVLLFSLSFRWWTFAPKFHYSWILRISILNLWGSFVGISAIIYNKCF